MIKCFEANYPESLGVVLVHRAPWVFQGTFRFLSPPRPLSLTFSRYLENNPWLARPRRRLQSTIHKQRRRDV